MYEFVYEGEAMGFSICDDRKNYQLNAGLSMLRTVFISIVLAGSAMLFGRDIEELVLTPVEKMVQVVKRLSKNPLEAGTIEERE